MFFIKMEKGDEVRMCTADHFVLNHTSIKVTYASHLPKANECTHPLEPGTIITILSADGDPVEQFTV